MQSRISESVREQSHGLTESGHTLSLSFASALSERFLPESFPAFPVGSDMITVPGTRDQPQSKSVIEPLRAVLWCGIRAPTLALDQRMEELIAVRIWLAEPVDDQVRECH